MDNNIQITDLLNKPFKEGGNGKDGYDCYTLSREVCRRVGINLPIKGMWVGEYIKLEKSEPFCIVVFSSKPPFVNHIGVMLDKYHFIHIMERRMVTVEKINHISWKNKVKGFYRYVNPSNNS